MQLRQARILISLFFLMGIPRVPAGALLFAFFALFHHPISLQHSHRRNPPYLWIERNYQYFFWKKLSAPSIGEGEVLFFKIWICKTLTFFVWISIYTLKWKYAWTTCLFLMYSSLETVLGGMWLVFKSTFKKCIEPFKRGQADKDSNVKMVPWPWQVLSHQ